MSISKTKTPHHAGSHSPEYALLGFLYQQAGHGYELHQRLTTELGYIWGVSQSQTYAILKRLEIQGSISATHEEQKKLPARLHLQITEAGRRQFEQWFNTSSGGSVRAIRLEFLTRLYFARKLFPDIVQRLIEDETADIQATLARMEKILATIPPEQTFNRLGLELRIRQLNSVLDWLKECRKEFVKSPRKKKT
jgi:PadR family transcriptional regulator AphA